MPFLRVVRDKRGYETTYLVHWYRDGHRQRTRILYVFRSPGGVCVGRTPLEPDVMRHLETQHPDIAFDWAVVRENKQVIDSAPEPRRRPRRADAEGPSKPAQPAGGDESPPIAQPTRLAIPAAIEGATPAEQIEFLTKWYPIVRDRVQERSQDRSSDPGRQEALLLLAERLISTAWTDADQIASGLQQAGEALERLSHVFAKRRRRPQRRPAETPRPDSAFPDSASLDGASSVASSIAPSPPEPAEPSATES